MHTRPIAATPAAVFGMVALGAAPIIVIRMTDFGFDPPEILGVLRAENTAELQPDFTAHRAT